MRVPPFPLAHRYEGEEWNSALDHVVEYAETTPCWDCWIAHKEKHGKVIR